MFFHSELSKFIVQWGMRTLKTRWPLTFRAEVFLLQQVVTNKCLRKQLTLWRQQEMNRVDSLMLWAGETNIYRYSIILLCSLSKWTSERFTIWQWDYLLLNHINYHRMIGDLSFRLIDSLPYSWPTITCDQHLNPGYSSTIFLMVPLPWSAFIHFCQ